MDGTSKGSKFASCMTCADTQYLLMDEYPELILKREGPTKDVNTNVLDGVAETMDIEGSKKDEVNNKGKDNKDDGDSDDDYESTDDEEFLSLQKAKTQKSIEQCFYGTQKAVHRMNRRKFFSKPWIFVPLNFKDYHWTFVALLNITYLNVEQDKKFTGYMYVDSFKYDLKDNETEQILIKKGIFNFIIYANMMYGKPNRVQYTNLYNLLMDNDRFTRIHVPVVDESTQADG